MIESLIVVCSPHTRLAAAGQQHTIADSSSVPRDLLRHRTLDGSGGDKSCADSLGEQTESELDKLSDEMNKEMPTILPEISV